MAEHSKKRCDLAQVMYTWQNFNMESIRTALRHPSLTWLLIKGYGSLELTKEHVAIHLREVSQIKMDENKLDPIDLVRCAIDLCSNPCYKAQFLYLVCRYIHPSKVVETGVHHGYSSAFVLKALEEIGGHLYSIDLPNVGYQTDDGGIRQDFLRLGAKTGFVVPDRLKANWELILGDSREKLPKLLESIGEIDIFHHDSMHTYDLMTFEYETVWPYLKDNGLLLSDDVGANNAFKDFCHRHSADYHICKKQLDSFYGIARKSSSGS